MGTNRNRAVIDGLLPVAMIYGDGPWKEPGDWIEVVHELFGLKISQTDMSSGVNRAINNEIIFFDSFKQQYRLSAATQEATSDRIAVGERLERSVQESWLAEVEHLAVNLTSEQLWLCLLTYAGKVFLKHGTDALELLSGTYTGSEFLPRDDNPESILKKAISECGLPHGEFDNIAGAIAVFFNGKDSGRLDYVGELANSTFNLLALEIDSDTRTTLLKNIPKLTLFVDTNVIYGIIGAHENPLSAVSAELFRVLQENDMGFKIYYHEKTLKELEASIHSVGDRLRRHQWTPVVSRALLNVRQNLAGIEFRYHQLNADEPTSVDAFLSRYANLPVLLASSGLTIFRDPNTSAEADYKKGEIVAQYDYFAKQKRKLGKQRTYQMLAHDVTIWQAAAARQSLTRGGPLFAGALVITADYLFRSFDREFLALEHGSGTWIVTSPDVLLQSIRPFISSGDQFNSVFGQIFSTPEFRGIAVGSNESLNKVASYLSTYADLPEETATKILSNSILMSSLKHISEDSDELARIIDAQIIRENEVLIDERDQLTASLNETRQAARIQLAAIEHEIKEIRSSLQTSGNHDTLDHINRIERLTRQTGNPSPVIIIENGNITMSDVYNDHSGGQYDNRNSQIGAQGPNAQVNKAVQNSDQRALTVNHVELSNDLERLKSELISHATNPKDYIAIAEVASAQEAVAKGDESSLKAHLANAGKWALEAAKKIGATVVESAIKEAIGLN